MSNKRLLAKNNHHEMAEAAHRVPSVPFYWLRLIATLPIRFYRLCISPMLPHACRYQPSCSVYAMEAIMRHGLFKGFWLSCWRILRCNPWVEGGLDPVPPKILRG